MGTLEAALLGIVQGLTEFLPVSSSGHLVLGGYLLGITDQHLFFDIMVHVATLVATLAFYRRSLQQMIIELVGQLRELPAVGWKASLATRPEARLAWLIVAATLPTGLIGIIFKDPLEALFGDPRAAAGMLLVTAALLISTRFVGPGARKAGDLRPQDALLLGVIQGMAIIPGISRSGSTIACAMFLKVDRELAARFSFLMSVPAIMGALVLKLAEGGTGVVEGGVGMVPLVVGFVLAAASGIGALALLVPVVRGGRFHWFAAYLVPAGLFSLWWIN